MLNIECHSVVSVITRKTTEDTERSITIVNKNKTQREWWKIKYCVTYIVRSKNENKTQVESICNKSDKNAAISVCIHDSAITTLNLVDEKKVKLVRLNTKRLIIHTKRLHKLQSELSWVDAH